MFMPYLWPSHGSLSPAVQAAEHTQSDRSRAIVGTSASSSAASVALSNMLTIIEPPSPKQQSLEGPLRMGGTPYTARRLCRIHPTRQLVSLLPGAALLGGKFREWNVLLSHQLEHSHKKNRWPFRKAARPRKPRLRHSFRFGFRHLCLKDLEATHVMLSPGSGLTAGLVASCLALNILSWTMQLHALSYQLLKVQR